MAYTRKISVKEFRDKFTQKLIEDGLAPEQAKKSASLMSKGDLEQVRVDFRRHPQIRIVNKQTGITIELPAEEFTNNGYTEVFLQNLASDNKELYEYLKNYLHQGGFLHLSEFLLAYYFTPDTRFETGNRVATFTIQRDGSLTYQEDFAIQKISTATGEYEASGQTPLVTLSLKSTLKVNNKEVDHQFDDLKVKAHDPVAEKFIADPRHRFAKFLSWLKNALQSFFSEAAKYQAEQREQLASPKRKL